jgi:hypothetical protein
VFGALQQHTGAALLLIWEAERGIVAALPLWSHFPPNFVQVAIPQGTLLSPAQLDFGCESDQGAPGSKRRKAVSSQVEIQAERPQCSLGVGSVAMLLDA